MKPPAEGQDLLEVIRITLYNVWYTKLLRELLSSPGPVLASVASFSGLFKEMKGYPVTIRLLDPPLHEFLPKREELLVKIAVLEAKGAKKNKAAITRASKMLRAVEELP